MNNELLKLFDIKDDVVETFTVDHKESNYEIDIRFKPSRSSCPTCGSTHFISKGNKKRSLVSVPVNDKPVKMITYVKRYKCLDCNASFSDVNPIAYDGWSFTRTAIISILNRLKPYNATYASVARMFGVFSTRIMEIFDTFVRKVEYICTDMSFIFKPLLKTYFPNSTLLVDHFHVTRLINDQLNHTRKRIMRKYAKNKKSREYRLLKHRYKILLKSRNNVDYETFKYDKIMECHVTENMILETLLSFDDELRQAYNAKEEYLIFDQVSKEEVNNSNKRKELNTVIKKFKHTHVEESISVAETLEHWKEEILNSFTWINDRRISNGPCEGKNNYVKKILSNANGMSNFQRARNRILYSQNKYETYTMNEHTDRIKRIGNPRGAYKK